jgi:hypothetical protein
MLKPGASIEGWIALVVDTGVNRPVMVFDPDSGGATGRRKILFFEICRDK